MIAADTFGEAGAYNIGPVAIEGVILEIYDTDGDLYDVPTGWTCVASAGFWRCVWPATLQPGGKTQMVKFNPPFPPVRANVWVEILPVPGEVSTGNNGGIA